MNITNIKIVTENKIKKKTELITTLKPKDKGKLIGFIVTLNQIIASLYKQSNISIEKNNITRKYLNFMTQLENISNIENVRDKIYEIFNSENFYMLLPNKQKQNYSALQIAMIKFFTRVLKNDPIQINQSLLGKLKQTKMKSTLDGIIQNRIIIEKRINHFFKELDEENNNNKTRSNRSAGSKRSTGSNRSTGSMSSNSNRNNNNGGKYKIFTKELYEEFKSDTITLKNIYSDLNRNNVTLQLIEEKFNNILKRNQNQKGLKEFLKMKNSKLNFQDRIFDRMNNQINALEKLFNTFSKSDKNYIFLLYSEIKQIRILLKTSVNIQSIIQNNAKYIPTLFELLNNTQNSNTINIVLQLFINGINSDGIIPVSPWNGHGRVNRKPGNHNPSISALINLGNSIPNSFPANCAFRQNYNRRKIPHPTSAAACRQNCEWHSVLPRIYIYPLKSSLFGDGPQSVRLANDLSKYFAAVHHNWSHRSRQNSLANTPSVIGKPRNNINSFKNYLEKIVIAQNTQFLTQTGVRILNGQTFHDLQNTSKSTKIVINRLPNGQIEVADYSLSNQDKMSPWVSVGLNKKGEFEDLIKKMLTFFGIQYNSPKKPLSVQLDGYVLGLIYTYYFFKSQS